MPRPGANGTTVRTTSRTTPRTATPAGLREAKADATASWGLLRAIAATVVLVALLIGVPLRLVVIVAGRCRGPSRRRLTTRGPPRH